tara:strand:- start:3116 stop:3499 length:384 start_codon:yes stop_codon:yes gene_type:complete
MGSVEQEQVTSPMMTLDPPTQESAPPARSSWVSNLTLGQLSGVAGLVLLFGGGSGSLTSAMITGNGDVVKQDQLQADLEELETRLRDDMAKDRQLELLAQEQALSTELRELGHKLDVIARHLEIELE